MPTLSNQTALCPGTVEEGRARCYQPCRSVPVESENPGGIDLGRRKIETTEKAPFDQSSNKLQEVTKEKNLFE